MALRPAPEKDIKPGISFAYPETSRQQSTQGAIARKKRPPILRGNYSYTCIESVHSLWRIVIGFIFTSKEVDSAEKRGSVCFRIMESQANSEFSTDNLFLVIFIKGGQRGQLGGLATFDGDNFETEFSQRMNIFVALTLSRGYLLLGCSSPNLLPIERRYFQKWHNTKATSFLFYVSIFRKCLVWNG